MPDENNASRTELGKVICASACEQVIPHVDSLDEYLNDNEHSGLEGWFRVAAVHALRKIKCTNVHVHNRGPDLKFHPPDLSDQLLLELKAGSFCHGYIWQIREGAGKYRSLDGFLGCLFLGRFNLDEAGIRAELQADGCHIVCLQHVAAGNNPAKWWVGILRKQSSMKAA
jgi:hypothetical protein